MDCRVPRRRCAAASGLVPPRECQWFAPRLCHRPALPHLCLRLRLQWALDPKSLSFAGATLSGRLDGGEAGAPPLSLTVRLLDTGAARIRVVENDGRAPRWEVSLAVNMASLCVAAARTRCARVAG